MESPEYMVPEITFQDFPESPDEIIKAKSEDVKNEEMLLFSQLDQLANNMAHDNNYQMIQEIDGVNQPGPSYSLQDVEGTTFDMMDTTFGHKLPVDLSNYCKVEGIKQEANTSHFVKYKLHEGKHIKIWECGICGKEFGHQYTLMRHLPTHTDERKFQCNTCGKAFRQMSTLSQHRAIHSSERPYVCEICQKTFNRVSTLISHRKTHTGLKPHRCHLCKKAFHQKGNLRNHIFTHTNERPYKCDICDKGFNQMSNLMCHKLKAHQRADKPKYICQICGKDFPKRMGLRNHEQYQHGLTKEKKEITTPDGNKFENAIFVDPINTEAMQLAIESNQTPFALLRPLTGIPVLVRVLPAGDKQMLVPASADDLKKYGQISISKVEAEGTSDVVKQEKQDGTTVQIKIPVVATVIQQNLGGHLSTSVVSPGPNSEDPSNGCSDNYVFTTNIQVVDNQEDIDVESYEPNYITNQMMEEAQIEFLDTQNKEFHQHLNVTHNLFDSLKNTDMMVNPSETTDIQNDMELSIQNSRNADLPYIIL